MSLSQNQLEDKFALFLKILGEESMADFSGGICNAFAFLNFRAAYYGIQDKNLERMNKVMRQDIKALAKNYRDYKKDHLLLIEQGKIDEKEDLKVNFLNKEIDSLYQRLTLLRKEKKEIDDKIDLAQKEQKEVELELTLRQQQLAVKIDAAEKKFRTFRVAREEQIQEILSKKYGSEKWKQAQEAEDLYVYIHTLLAAFDPFGKFYFRIEGNPVQQWDFIEILQLLPIDMPSEKDKKDKKETQPAIQQVFQIAFNFTKEELIAFFDNKLHDNTICEGDLIHIVSSNHALFLTRQKGCFELYDPGAIELKDNTAETLVSALEDRFFKQFEVTDTKMMPIGITIFEKSGKEKIERPERLTLLRAIMDKRPDKNVDKPAWERWILLRAIMDIMDKRSDKNVDKPAWDGSTAAYMAASYGHIDSLQFLIEKKADVNLPDKDGWTPAIIAAQNGHTGTIRVLAELKANVNLPNKEGGAPALMAAKNGHTGTIRVLAELKADINLPNKNGWTPAMIAAKNGHTGTIRVLAELKANVNLPDKDGWTPAIIAAENGHTGTIRVLAELKADVNLPNKEGGAPALMAAKNGHAGTIRVLAELKADVNLPNKNGWTPAMIATQDGHTGTIRVLAELKADVNLPSPKTGWTPALMAAKNGHTGTIRVLAELKADVNLPNPKTGSTPVLIAAQNGHTEIVQFLEEMEKQKERIRKHKRRSY